MRAVPMPGKPARPHVLARPQVPSCPEALSALRCCGRQASCRLAPAKELGRGFSVQPGVYQMRKIAV